MTTPAITPAISARTLIAIHRDRSALYRLWSLLRVERGLIGVGLFWQFWQVVTYLPFTAATQYLIDIVIVPSARWQHLHLTTPERGWLLVGFVGANVLLWPIHALATVKAFAATQLLVRATVARMRRMVVDQLQHLNLSFYGSRGSGALSNQITVDLNRVEGFLQHTAGNFFVAFSIGVITSLYLAFVNPWLLGLALIAVPVQLLIIKLFSNRLQFLNKRVQKTGEQFSAKIVEFVTGQRLTRSLGNEELAATRLGQSIDDMRTAGYQASITARWMAMWLQMSWQFMPVVLWAVGGWMIMGNTVTLGELIAFIGLFGFVMAGFQAFIGVHEQWLPAKPGMEAILSILDSAELEDYVHPQRHLELHGDIRCTDVAFTYPGSSRPVLYDVTLHIPAGQRIGLVGETGAGKSTFLDLILAFQRPTHGTILWDDHELAVVGRRQLRRQMAIMGQDAFLWNTTIRENIRLGRPGATDDEVITAATRAQAHAFITAQEQGYDTEVGERGGKLSGGQRQRIALARLFLRSPRIVVLDEPTSALDLETEAKLQLDLDQLCAGRTTFIVAHRLSTLRNVDRILVFADGRIIEDGTPAELLGRPNGHFRQLHDLQWNPLAAQTPTSDALALSSD